MDLIALPVEVFIIILRKLDLKSLLNMYNSCQYARNVIQSNTITKIWYATRNSMATGKYLNSMFFKDIAGNLQELNLCGAVAISKTKVLPALKQMKHLKTLDVSYTEIGVMDFYDMFCACPTIRNVSINFTFHESNFQYKPLEKQLERYQNVFKYMENIHFIGTTSNLLFSNIIVKFLEKSNLNNLKLSIIQLKNDYTLLSYVKESCIKFKELFLYFMTSKTHYNYVNFSNYLICNINNDNFDKIFIVYGDLRNNLKEITVYASPAFKEFFLEKFNIEAKSIAELGNDWNGNMVVMIFNKELVKYENIFFTRLHKIVKGYFPYIFEHNRLSPVPNHFDWYYVYPNPHTINRHLCIKNLTEKHFKKRRIANPYIFLDYNLIFKRNHEINLSIVFAINSVNPVSLKSDSKFLSKVTFLSLSGDAVRYSDDFFRVLFSCCSNLVTLDVSASTIYPCVSPISSSLPLSKTLKNIRLVDKSFNYNKYFHALSQCKTLENIYIVENFNHCYILPDPCTIFTNCVNLYNICIKTSMSDKNMTAMKQMFRKAAQDRPQIKIRIDQINITEQVGGFSYDPSIEVFKTFPIVPKNIDN